MSFYETRSSISFLIGQTISNRSRIANFALIPICIDVQDIRYSFEIDRVGAIILVFPDYLII
jgi:hypothetical protein